MNFTSLIGPMKGHVLWEVLLDYLYHRWSTLYSIAIDNDIETHTSFLAAEICLFSTYSPATCFLQAPLVPCNGTPHCESYPFSYNHTSTITSSFLPVLTLIVPNISTFILLLLILCTYVVFLVVDKEKNVEHPLDFIYSSLVSE